MILRKYSKNVNPYKVIEQLPLLYNRHTRSTPPAVTMPIPVSHDVPIDDKERIYFHNNCNTALNVILVGDFDTDTTAFQPCVTAAVKIIKEPTKIMILEPDECLLLNTVQKKIIYFFPNFLYLYFFLFFLAC
jgi:hypothetical protein